MMLQAAAKFRTRLPSQVGEVGDLRVERWRIQLPLWGVLLVETDLVGIAQTPLGRSDFGGYWNVSGNSKKTDWKENLLLWCFVKRAHQSLGRWWFVVPEIESCPIWSRDVTSDWSTGIVMIAELKDALLLVWFMSHWMHEFGSNAETAVTIAVCKGTVAQPRR
jgi:hypothetical protein